MSRTRRDPRAERALHLVAGTARPRLDRAAAAAAPSPAGRPRRDPRAEAEAALVPGPARRRLDRSLRPLGLTGQDGHIVHLIEPEIAPTAPPRIVVVEDPAFLVAAVPDAPGGRLTAHDRQVLGAARLLAEGGGAVVALPGGPVEELGSAGADRAQILAGATDFDPEGRAAALAAALRQLKVRHAVFPETPEGGDLARRVAAALGEPLFASAESLTAKAVSRAARGRRVEQRAAPPRLVSLTADAVAAYAGAPREARDIKGLDDVVAPPRAIVSAMVVPADPATVPLSEAEFVVSAGNGITDFERFRAVVAALRATPGASRVVCDAGLMPRAAQVGASGTVLDATCYFALGIAGAPQHLQGVARCEHVVAVNTDLHAAMIERAGLAIVADAQQVMPALLAALEAEETRE